MRMNRRRIEPMVFYIGVAFMLMACSAEQPATPADPQVPVEAPLDQAGESERLTAWLDEKYADYLNFIPITKTIYGIKDEDQSRIDDFSNEGIARALEWQRRTLAQLEDNFVYEQLSDEDQDSYDLWVSFVEQDLTADLFRDNAFVFNQMFGLHAGLPQLLIALHQVDSREDLEAYLSRIGESGRAIEQLVARSREIADAGVRPPYFAFESVAEQAQAIITGAPFDESDDDSPVWADFKAEAEALEAAGKLSESEASSMLEMARAALVERWLPAYRALIDWQNEDRTNATGTADTVTGVGSLPRGAEYYEERLAYHTTTDLTADEVHQIGLDNVARIQAEMEAIKSAVAFEGSLQDFFDLLRDSKDDARFYFTNDDDGRQGYIDQSSAAIQNIKTNLPEFFGVLPKADIVVKRVEAFRERPGAAQHYNASSPDGSRPGVYYAHLIDMNFMPKYELEVVAYHEGIPGHHMQIAIANELEDVPEFRKLSGHTAFIEGWALYSERLAKEIPGTYQNPYSDFGRLQTEIWRAIRLVVDTGLHAKGWTEAQAIDYMTSNSSITAGQARSEVRRYIVAPGQATGYMIGMLKILELRERAENALGEAFDIRAFHDTVIGQGSMPLDLLERKIDRWIAAH